MKEAFVVFDRDGTLIEHIHYLADPDLVKFKPDLVTSLRILNDANIEFGIITNQSLVGRNIATIEKVLEIHDRIQSFVKSFGLQFTFILLCPHTPDDNCSCRKPNVSLGLIAIEKFNLSAKCGFMVGDQESDLQFGKKLGWKTVHISNSDVLSHNADYTATKLEDAANWIIKSIEKEN